jgi:hypothetical protein
LPVFNLRGWKQVKVFRVYGAQGKERSMLSPDYLRRQALSALNLAQSATNSETKRHLIELANEYMMRADSAAQVQLAACVGRQKTIADRLTIH